MLPQGALDRVRRRAVPEHGLVEHLSPEDEQYGRASEHVFEEAM